MTPEAGLRERAEAWIAADPDPETRRELRSLIDAGDRAALADRFDGRLAFGTAGLRGTMAAGPNRMNRVVVRQSAAGIARYMLGHVPGAAAAGVVVAHDARHRSAAFAADVADVLGRHGIRAVTADAPLPTPVAVHAIRAVGAAAGIVVTASHNPPHDNGLKLYMGDAAQIVPPVDGLVAAEIARAAQEAGVERRRPGVPTGASAEAIPEAVLEGYRRATLARVPPPAAPIRIATTAMHGVGGAWIADLLARAGHGDVHPVPEQSSPDPDFPTVAFPNPEEPGATGMLAERMAAVDADLGIALDPDADRVAVLVPDASIGASRIRQLTGDEVGALLGEWLLAEVTSGPDRLTVSSVVSSSLLGKVAAHHGARHQETLTGFKWLSRPAMEHPEWTQVLAYEEAIGYAIGADVRDKDGISAGVAVASMASWARARGLTLPAMLDALHARHGAHVTDNFSLRDEAPGGAERRAALVGRLTAAPPERVGEERVTGVASLASDVLRIDLAGGTRVVVRPSGTEPKLKCYCEAVEPVGGDGVEAARARARARLAGVRAALEPLLLD
ncbi:MAG TPA: phospho-sugar mutase [Miltoncostaeaceae bacterium]|nr:phospho-sugar mutase [Miltoncostaeaceae bacterium]